MVRKGLLKRVLPAVLSAAMIFTSVPANAFAAETAPAIEAEADEITDLTEEAPAEAPAEEPPVDAEEPAATGEENEDAYEDLATFQPTILVDLAKVKAKISTEGANANTDEAKYLSYAEDNTFVTDYEYAQDAGLNIWTAVGYAEGNALSVKTEVGMNSGMADTDGVSIDGTIGWRTDVLTNTGGSGGSWADEAYYNAFWVKEDGTALDPGVQPDSVGTWKLKFALAENAVHKAAENTDIVLRVTETPVLIDGIVQNAAAGSKIGDLIDENKIKFNLETAKVNNKWVSDADLEAIIDPAKTVIKVSYATIGANGEAVVDTSTALAATDLFMKDKNYALTFNFTLREDAAKCYVLPEKSYLITVGDMAPVAPEFTYSDALIPSRGVNITYNGSEVKAEDVTKYIESGKFITGIDTTNDNISNIDPGTETDLITDVKTKIASAETAAASNLTTYWAYDNEGKKKLRDDEVVLHAGTYFYIIEYNDPTATYNKCLEAIKVNIIPANVIVQPILDPTTVAEGYTANEILADVTYKVLNTQSNEVIFSNKRGDSNYDEEKVTYFWGVAYNEDEYQSTQSYEPTFKVQKIEKQGENTLDPVDVRGDEALVYDANISYRIVFTGNKAVRDRTGDKMWWGMNAEYDINSTDGDLHDYHVSVDDATVLAPANIVLLSINQAAATTIDTTLIVEAIAEKNVSADKAKGDKFSTPFEADFTADADETTEDKGLPLYANKGEYKKAVVKAGAEEAAKDNDESLTYTWERFNEDDEIAVHSIWGDDAGGDPVFKSRLAALEDEDGVVFDAPEKEPEKPATERSADDPLWIAYERDYPAWLVWNDEGSDDGYTDGDDYFEYDEWKYDDDRYPTWQLMTTYDDVYETWGVPGENTYVGGNYSFFDAENAIAPSEPGIYRLKIDYKDRKEHKNKPATAYVYYVIHPRDAMVEIAGAPAAFADGVITLEDVHNSLQSTDSTKTNTYVKITLYEANLASDGTLTKTTAIPITEEEQKKIDSNLDKLLVRQRKETVAGDKIKWFDYDGVLQYIAPGNDTYRFEFDAKSRVLYKDYDVNGNNAVQNYLGRYYNFYGAKMGKHNQLLTNQPDNPVATVALTVKESQAIPVYIDLDESAMLTYSKIYDGKPIDLSPVKATVKEVDTDAEVAGASCDITWEAFVGWDESVNPAIPEYYSGMPLAQAVHVSNYTITYHFYATEKYRTTQKDLSVQYQILPKELKIVPEIKDPVFAGNRARVYSDLTPDVDDISDNVVASWKLDETGLDKEGSDAGVIGQVESNIDEVRQYAEVFETELNKDPLRSSFNAPLQGIGNDYLKSNTEYYVYLHALQAYSGKYLYNTMLSGQMTDIYGFKVYYNDDYTLVDTATAFTPVINHSNVSSATKLYVDVTPYAAGSDYTTTIKSIQGIKADATTHDHYLQLKIQRPQEFVTRGHGFKDDPAHFAFKESIENAVRSYGGNLDAGKPGTLEGVIAADTTADTITLKFNVDLMQASETANGVAKFDIVWDEDAKYVEHYVVDMSKAPLLADLSIASMPKKVKFNAVNKKMFVGDTQQLDVKITKNQQEDVIWLGYESDNEEVLAIYDMMTDGFKTDGNDGLKYYKDNEDYEGAGFVTALKPGKATITVYACKQVYDPVEKKDMKVKISEKPLAKVAINVKALTAPKALKVTPKDTWAALQYKMPNNGYRRELYVAEGKVSKGTFEELIKSVTNGNYTRIYGNENAPFVFVRFGVDEQVWNKEKSAYEAAKPNQLAMYDDNTTDPAGGDLIYVDDLEPEKQYTVYVRNVSGLRGLDDDARVSVSTAGAVKTFKTIKSAVIKLKLGVKGDTPENADWADKSADETQWQVLFKNKTAQMETSGWFLERYIKDYSDAPDYVWRKLPLTDAAEKKAYQAQKLTYIVYDYGTGGTTTTAPEKKNMKFYGKFVLNGNTYYYKKSNLATINKKGKLTLKGEGVINVMVIDTVSGKTAETTVFIDAQPDTVTPVKSLKIQSGEMVRLSDLLTYKEGGKTINAYQGISDPETKAHLDMYADLSVAQTSNADFRLEKITNNTQGYKSTPYWNEDDHKIAEHETYDYLITSLKKDGDLTLDITDSAVATYGGADKTATLKLTSKALEPVKNLSVKCKDSSGEDIGGVRHDYACGSYTHSIQGVYADKGTDADKSQTINGQLRIRQNLYDGGGPKKGKLLRSVVKTVKPMNYDFAKKKWVYAWSESDLTPMQNYVIGITVLNDLGEETEYSKEVTKKFKTTDIAASTSMVSKKADFGGARIYVSETGEASGAHTSEVGLDHDAESMLNLYPLLTSGNTYTLSPVLEHDTNGWFSGDIITASNNRKSDKLTWKLSDTKVAKIKVKSGTYSASLQALKPGKTVLTVKSKITKKTIAKWPIYIGAVSNAKSYFGTNEPYTRSAAWDYSYTTPAENMIERDILEVTLDNEIQKKLEIGETQWFVFEAPAYGEYTIRRNYTPYIADTFEKGQKVYIRCTNLTDNALQYTVDVSGTMYDIVNDTTKGVGVKPGHSFVFYAPEDNFYSFSYTDDKDNIWYLNNFTTTTAKLIEADNSAIAPESDQMTVDPTDEKGIGAKKGQEIRVTLNKTGNMTTDKEYVVNITKRGFVSFDEKTAGTFTLKNVHEGHADYKDKAWFKFEAPADGLYTFTRTDADSSESVTTYDYSDNLINDDIEDTTVTFATATPVKGRTFAMKKGDVRVFVISSEDATEAKPATGTISVKAETFADIALDAATATAAAVEKDQTRYFKVTAPATEGAITVKAEDLGTAPDDAIVTYFADLTDFDGGYVLNGEQEFQIISEKTKVDATDKKLQVGAPLYIKVVLNGGATADKNDTAKLSAATKKVIKLVPGTASEAVTLGKDKKFFYTFSVPKNGISKLYRFTFKSADKTRWTAKLGTTAIASKIADGTDDIYAYVAAEEFKNSGILTIASEAEDEGTITVQVDALDFENIAFTAENPNVATITKTAAKAGTYYFRFAAPENDVYTADIESKDGTNVTVAQIDKTGVVGGGYFDVNNGSTANRWVYMGYINRSYGWVLFRVTTDTDDKDLNVRITRRNAKEITKTDGTAEEVDIPVNADGWFKFSAKENTKYAFKVETEAAAGIDRIDFYAGSTLTSEFDWINNAYSENHDGKVYIFNEIEGKNTSESSNINERLNQHRTVYFRLIAGDKTVATKVKVSVTKYDPTPITLAEVGEKAVKLAIKDDGPTKNNGKGVWYRFTAPEAGNYTFILKSTKEEAGDYKVLQLKVGTSGYNNTDTKTAIYRYSTDLNAGQEIDIHVKTGVDDEYTGTLEIKRATETKFALATDTTDTQFELAYDGAVYSDYVYQVEEDGWYSYKLSTEKKEANEMGATVTVWHLDKDGHYPGYDDYYADFDSDPVVENYIYMKELERHYFSFSRDDTNITYPTDSKDPVKVHLALKKVEPKAMGLDTAETVELTTKQKKWYSYKAAESGLYKFNIEATAKTFHAVIRLNDGSVGAVGLNDADPTVDKDVVGSEKMEEGFLLSKGDTIYFTATNDSATDNATGTMKISKVNVESGALKANDAATDNVTIGVSGETWFYFPAQASDTTYTFTTYDNHIKDTTTPVSLNMTVYRATALLDDDTNKPDGRYAYGYVDDDNHAVNWSVGNIKEGDKYRKEVYVKLVDVDGSDPTEAAPFVGKLLVTTDTALTLGTPATFTLDHTADSPYGKQIFTYVVPQDKIVDYNSEAFYTVSFTHDPANANAIYKKSVKVYNYNKNTKVWNLVAGAGESDNNLMSYSTVLAEGQKIEITLEYDGTQDSTKDTKGTVTVANTVAAADIAITADLADEGTAYTVTKNSEKWFKVDPSSDGAYKVQFTNDNDVANVDVYTYKPEKHDVDDTEVTIDKYARTLTTGVMVANTTAPGNEITVFGQKKDNSFYVRIYNDSATDVTGKIRVIKP